ncbi:uncharacterized protein [Argopecten irradians]|uniref:uncharacterized protein n=1 Tax=Argopecten irradians TaxID=31199 RepID=UPI0037180E7F
MLPLVFLLILPCINGQGFQSSVTPNWGQTMDSAANQERLLASLLSRGWTPPPDVQRELATAANRARQTTGGVPDEFGNRFNFGFTPDQLVAPGLTVDQLIPTNNGGQFGATQDPAAANSLASLPNSMQIPGSLTQGLVNRGLLDPTLVNPNLAGRGLMEPTLVNPNIAGRGLMDPTLLNPNLARRGLMDPTLLGTGFIDPSLLGSNIGGPSLADAALLGRRRRPGLVNIIRDNDLLGPVLDPLGLGSVGRGVDPIGLGPLGPDPLDSIGPGVIGIAGKRDHLHDDRHHDKGINAVKEKLAKTNVIKKKLKKELKARKKVKKVEKILKKEAGIGHTNGKIVAHGDHFHLDDKILKVVGRTGPHHRPPPPPRRDVHKRQNPVKSLMQGLLIGGLGALLGGK